jgi:copper ion binding protein
MTRVLLAAAVLAALLLQPAVQAAEPTPPKPAAAAAGASKVAIPVDGMTCSSCVSNVGGALKRLTGVTAVDVSLEHKRVLVSYDAARVTPAAMVDAIRQAGYQPGTPSPN